MAFGCKDLARCSTQLILADILHEFLHRLGLYAKQHRSTSVDSSRS